MEKWAIMGGYQDPHGLQSGGIRRSVRRPRSSAGDRFEKVFCESG